MGSYVHEFRATTLPSKGTWEDFADLRSEPDIPKGAIAHEITIGGCLSTVSSKRYFRNQETGWTATGTTFSYTLAVTDKSRLDQRWEARMISTSTSSHSFTPTMRLRYVAPIIP